MTDPRLEDVLIASVHYLRAALDVFAGAIENGEWLLAATAIGDIHVKTEETGAIAAGVGMGMKRAMGAEAMVEETLAAALGTDNTVFNKYNDAMEAAGARDFARTLKNRTRP